MGCGHAYAQPAAGLGVGVATVYRYVTETAEVLAALAPNFATTTRTAACKAFVILDGTLLPIDRIAADRPYYSGRYKKHGMNVQVIADPIGRLLWASTALPGAVHDIKAARTHEIIDALAEAGVRCWADKAYQGAGGTVRVPCHGRWARLSSSQRADYISHARIRAVGDQAMATLKSWRLLRKLRCSTTRITDLVKAILALPLMPLLDAVPRIRGVRGRPRPGRPDCSPTAATTSTSTTATSGHGESHRRSLAAESPTDPA